jgi:hypothetical protein
MSPISSRILQIFKLSSQTCSQIWLIPLVDDHPAQHAVWVGYITKLGIFFKKLFLQGTEKNKKLEN